MNKYVKYLVIVIPVLFVLFGSRMELAKFGNDPNYVYLVNATALCNGENVGYIDHPGTTMMQISALTIAVQHLLSNPESQTLTEHVLNDSHTFILSIRNVMLALNALILLLLGWVAFKKTKSIWPALLLQVSTFLTANTLDHVWTKVSPEPFLFFMTAVYVMAILYFYFAKDKNSWKHVAMFSLAVGAGLATKATFLPLVILPFLVLPTFKRKFVFLAGLIPSFVLFTIPIISEYKFMYYWFLGLIGHSGIYGHGEKGFIDFSTYFPNLLQIVVNNWLFALVVLVGAIVAVASIIQTSKRKTSLSWEVKILFGLAASMGFGILLVAKHYHVNHYLVPVLLLSGITLYFIWLILQQNFNNKILNKFGLPAVLVFLTVFLAFTQPAKMKYANDGYKLTNTEMDDTNAMMERDYPDYRKVYYYPNSLNQYSALNFGDVYSRRRMLSNIKAVHGDTYFYHSIEKRIKNWNVEVSVADIIREHGNKILLVGGPRDSKEVAELWINEFPVQEIYKGRIQAIYVLDTLRYNQLILDKEKNIQEVFSFNAEKVSTDSKKLLASNGVVLGNVEIRTNEKSRSGEYSIKMDGEREFALEYQLTNVKPGENYEIEIWKHSDNESGRLVVSAKDSRQFYKAQNTVLLSDENGWGIIRIKITIPPELQDSMLKIYLWNPDKKLSYFDDFSIRKIGVNQ